MKPCLEIILGMICDRHSSDIRSSAALAVKPLLDAYIYNYNHLHTISRDEACAAIAAIVERLLYAVHGETNKESKSCGMEALRDSLLTLYETGVEDVVGNRSGFIYDVSTVKVDNALLVESIIKECLLQVSESYNRLLLLEASNANNEGLDKDEGAIVV